MAECGKLDIISGHKAVCLCSFHNAVDHCAGLCTGRRVAEQPVLSADSKGTYLVFCTVGGLLLHGVLLAAFLYFQTALKIHLWYYFLTLERAGKDMVSLGGSERIAEEYLIKIFEALFVQSRYYRELFPVEKEKMMSEMIWLLTNRQNNRYYEHIASPWRSRFVRLKMPVTGEDYDETDCRNVRQRFLPAA